MGGLVKGLHMEKEQAKISRTARYIDAYELSNLILCFLLSFEGHFLIFIAQ